MMTNEERIKKGVKESHERIRKVLSPRAIKMLEEERSVGDRVISMLQNLEKFRCKGTPSNLMFLLASVISFFSPEHAPYIDTHGEKYIIPLDQKFSTNIREGPHFSNGQPKRAM